MIEDYANRVSNVDSAQNSVFGVDIWFLLRLLRRGWWFILLAMLVALGLTLLALTRITPVYKSSAILEVKQESRNIVDVSDIESVVADREFLTTQVELLQSRKLINDVVINLNLKSDPYLFNNALPDLKTVPITEKERIAGDALLRNLKVDSVGRSRLIEVSVEHTSAKKAALIANSITETFISNSMTRKFNSTKYARSFLEDRLKVVKASLEKVERELVDYASDNGIIKLADGKNQGIAGTLDSRELIELSSKLTEAELELFESREAYEAIKGSSNISGVLDSSIISNLRSKRTDIYSEYVEKLSIFKPQYPSMLELKSRIDSLDKEIAEESDRLKQTSTEEAQINYDIATKKVRDLSLRVKNLKLGLADIQEKNVEYNILSRELETERSQYDALLLRMKEVSVSDEVGSNLVEIVDEAKAARHPFKPNRQYAILFALLTSAILAFGGVFVLEILDDRVRDPEDVKIKLKQIVMGVIPVDSQSADNVYTNSAGFFDPESEPIYNNLRNSESKIAEAYSSLRTNLQFSGPNGGPRVIQLTSTRSGEGKSTSSMGLAYRFAGIGEKVLLIDADMRRPTFGNDPNNIGLSGLLTTSEEFGKHVVKTETSNLHLIVAGNKVPNPAEILSSTRFDELLAWAKQNYGYVIVDSPPILGLADAPLLGAKVDATLLMIDTSSTSFLNNFIQKEHKGTLRTPNIRNSIERVQKSGTKLLGVVLTKYSAPRQGYSDYYKYAYGKGSGEYSNVRNDKNLKKAKPKVKV